LTRTSATVVMLRRLMQSRSAPNCPWDLAKAVLPHTESRRPTTRKKAFVVITYPYPRWSTHWFSLLHLTAPAAMGYKQVSQLLDAPMLIRCNRGFT
jgi:hypothetical protein